jgi:hypothetical protein
MEHTGLKIEEIQPRNTPTTRKKCRKMKTQHGDMRFDRRNDDRRHGRLSPNNELSVAKLIDVKSAIPEQDR